jgi:hypothetical protein
MGTWTLMTELTYFFLLRDIADVEMARDHAAVRRISLIKKSSMNLGQRIKELRNSFIRTA